MQSSSRCSPFPFNLTFNGIPYQFEECVGEINNIQEKLTLEIPPPGPHSFPRKYAYLYPRGDVQIILDLQADNACEDYIPGHGLCQV